MGYYHDVYLKRLNRYGVDFQSRIQRQREEKRQAEIARSQQRLDQANKELDKLVGVRTRQIQRKLKNVQSTDALLDNSSLLE